MKKIRPRKRNRSILVLVSLVLLAGAVWMGWKQGLLKRSPREKVVAAAERDDSTNSSSRAVVPVVDLSRTNIPAPAPLRAGANELKPPTTNASVAKSTAVLEAQVALDRMAISPGSIDGVLGSQTRAALRAFQTREGLPVTGDLDAATRARLPWLSAPLTTHRIEATDIDRLLPLAANWLGKSEQPRLDYETLLELVAERGHVHPNLVRRLNASADWNSLPSGSIVHLPAAERVRPETKAAFVRIRMADRTLQAFDSTNRLLAHFPCSIAARVDKRPVGELRVTVVVPNPDYIFNPENFPESAEAQELGRKLRLNPGPNNPVGTAWIGLNLSGYGIHGTPKPEDVGRTESHGCFRLANWNAEYLLQLVTVGTRVLIEQ